MYKVYIRPLSIEDAKTSHQWRNDPEIWKFTGSKPDREITYEIEKEWIKKVISDETCRRFAIIADGNYIGNIQLTNIKDKKAEYHIFIGDKLWWGRGISHLATHQILHFAKEELLLEEVFLSVREENIAAIRSYRKSSFAERESADGWIKMVCVLEQLPDPMVSVFVMVYNHEKYLQDCLDGILMQQCNFAFNIVVGEDCSPDRSREILLEYQKDYPGKFKLLLHEKNIGAFANQSAVLSACTGKYIALCEGDDYWTDPLKLQKQVDFLEQNKDYSISFGGYRVYCEVSKESYNATSYLKAGENDFGYSFDLLDIKYTWITSTLTAVFRRYRSMNDDLGCYSFFKDSHIFYELLKKGRGFYFTEIFATYRKHAGGQWSSLNVDKQMCDEEGVLAEMYFKNKDEYTRSKLLAHRCNILQSYIFNNNTNFSLGFVMRGISQAIILVRSLDDLKVFIYSFIPMKSLVKIKQKWKLIRFN